MHFFLHTSTHKQWRMIIIFTFLTGFPCFLVYHTFADDKFWTSAYKTKISQKPSWQNRWEKTRHFFHSSLDNSCQSLHLESSFSNTENNWKSENMGVLRASGNQYVELVEEAKSSTDVHPLCQIRPATIAPHCPKKFLLIHEWCYHIASHKERYQEAKHLCESKYHKGKQGHLVSDLTCTDIDKLQGLLSKWKNGAADIFCGDCCPRNRNLKVTCVDMKEKTYKEKHASSCNCSCTVCTTSGPRLLKSHCYNIRGIWSPTTCQCFKQIKFNGFPDSKTWNECYTHCSRSPVTQGQGLRGRLAVIPNNDVHQLLMKFVTVEAWIGLRTKLIPHSIGGPLALSVFLSEGWMWYEGDIPVANVTWLPKVLVDSTTGDCIYYVTSDTANYVYHDETCEQKRISCLCEFLEGSDVMPRHCDATTQGFTTATTYAHHPVMASTIASWKATSRPAVTFTSISMPTFTSTSAAAITSTSGFQPTLASSSAATIKSTSTFIDTFTTPCPTTPTLINSKLSTPTATPSSTLILTRTTPTPRPTFTPTTAHALSPTGPKKPSFINSILSTSTLTTPTVFVQTVSIPSFNPSPTTHHTRSSTSTPTTTSTVAPTAPTFLTPLLSTSTLTTPTVFVQTVSTPSFNPTPTTQHTRSSTSTPTTTSTVTPTAPTFLTPLLSTSTLTTPTVFVQTVSTPSFNLTPTTPHARSSTSTPTTTSTVTPTAPTFLTPLLSTSTFTTPTVFVQTVSTPSFNLTPTTPHARSSTSTPTTTSTVALTAPTFLTPLHSAYTLTKQTLFIHTHSTITPKSVTTTTLSTGPGTGNIIVLSTGTKATPTPRIPTTPIWHISTLSPLTVTAAATFFTPSLSVQPLITQSPDTVLFSTHKPITTSTFIFTPASFIFTSTSPSVPSSAPSSTSTDTGESSLIPTAATSVSTRRKKLTTTTTMATSATAEYPLSEVEEVVVNVMQSLGCTFILIILGVTLVTYWILHDWSYERFLHMNQEIALFVAHILVLFLRDRVDLHIPCKLTAVGLQFFFTVTFSFLALEALQTYAIRTNVICSDGYFTRMQFFVIGWCGPAVIAAVSSVTSHSEYVSTWSCWMNLKSNISMATVGPVLVLAAMAIIMAEAAGMGNYKPLPRTNKNQATAAVANQKALFLVVPLNIFAWYVGLYAVFYVNIALYSLVAALNISLGVSIFVFHTLGNPKVHAIFKQMFKKICG